VLADVCAVLGISLDASRRPAAFVPVSALALVRCEQIIKFVAQQALPAVYGGRRLSPAAG
jgi:hypothetical protein